jgi:hypothetical protein
MNAGGDIPPYLPHFLFKYWLSDKCVVLVLAVSIAANTGFLKIRDSSLT